MAGPSDRARFYLEQSVPELQDDLRKQIFSKDEITSITKKRSDFEHILNARGASPSDYMRYAEYEMNLNSLRVRRIKRLGVKSSHYTGSRRIFFILDRGTRKFHGDLGLWMQYITFARSQKSYKKLEQILTSMLRMHPTKPELWIYAASYTLETQADVGGARGYMQRGVRFCAKCREIWLEYAKLEMIYIGKIEGRRKILGLDMNHTQRIESPHLDDKDADEIALPIVTGEDMNPSSLIDDSVNEAALRKMALSPVLDGAIPIAIFDSAMKELNSDPMAAEAFFNMFMEFENISCTDKILKHVLTFLQSSSAGSISALCCAFRLPIISVECTSPDFPSALGQTLEGIKNAIMQYPQSATAILEQAIRSLVPLITDTSDHGELDSALSKVIYASLKRFIAQLSVEELSQIIWRVKERRPGEARTLVDVALKIYEMEEMLMDIQKSLGEFTGTCTTPPNAYRLLGSRRSFEFNYLNNHESN